MKRAFLSPTLRSVMTCSIGSLAAELEPDLEDVGS